MRVRRATAFILLIGALTQLSRPSAPTTRIVVELRPTAQDPAAAAQALAARYGLTPQAIYRHALAGFSADAPPAVVAALRQDAAVATIGAVEHGELLGMAAAPAPNPTRQLGQIIPAGIRRIGADRSPIARIDGVDTALDVDVAVIDSGIDGAQPDLNLYRSATCADGAVNESVAAEDLTGHGTAVANVLAARDNNIGVVGVAPGARLWSMRVAQRAAGGRIGYSSEDLLCAVDWLAAHADQIDVANISLGSYAADGLLGGRCGEDGGGATALLHRAICGATAAGVTIVVAAGEPRTAMPRSDVAQIAPAAFDEVITVSAMADLDGRAGGQARQAACVTRDRDDTFADDSNYGAGVDLAAPGVCVATGPSAYWNGTSFAAPHVAGAAALLKVLRPQATPGEVRRALIAAAEQGWNTARTTARPQGDDPDSYAEPLVNVAALAPPVREDARRPGNPRITQILANRLRE